MERQFLSRRHTHPQGAALVIVLTFVVLLTGLVVAFLSRTVTERQASNGSANQAKADILARSCVDLVVSALKQEMEANSAKTTASGITFYTPNAPANVVPLRSGVPAGPSFANMIRRSVRVGDPTAAPGDQSLASAVNSETSLSLDGRFISKARWNAHYLLAKTNTGNDATDPDAAFVSPDWVIVSRNGISVKADSDVTALRDPATPNFTLGRFAYVIYDEGGLLDVNVAGYPTDGSGALGTDAPVRTKGWLALADLTQAIPGSGTIAEKQTAANKLIGWRNRATGNPGGVFPSFTFTTTSGSSWYANFVTNNTSGFLNVSSTNSSGPTDQAFVSRQELIKFRRAANMNVNALQYMGTFSRESNNPTWSNASTRRVTAPFIRRDGTTAQSGEPLIRRFPISQIAWLGPTGVVAPGTPTTVRRDFGLVWNADHWDYYGPSTSVSLASAIPGISGSQEPDFFQLLALAKPTASIQQILTIGACLIDQFDSSVTDPASATTRIDYDGPPMPPSTTNSIAWGMENVTPPAPTGAPTPRGALILNRRFSNVGEFGYSNRDITSPAPAPTPPTLDFFSDASSDAAILDLFAATPVKKRAGSVNLNTRQDLVVRAMISLATASEPSTAISSTKRNSTSTDFVAATIANPATSRAELARLIFQSGITIGLSGAALEEYKEIVARSLADMTQTRTWNLMIDMIAQSGRYPSTATNLSQFVVEGEKRYWLHVAIDRFTGEVIDQQLEAVNE